MFTMGVDFHYQNVRMNLNNIPDKVGILIPRMGSMFTMGDDFHYQNARMNF
jgi:hypothetical protein